MHSVVSETIWSCREIDENNVHLNMYCDGI